MPDRESSGVKSVPYIVHESAMAREERKQKRLVTALLLAILLIFASNAIWLWAWTEYDYVVEETTVETTGSGHANYVGANASEVIFNNGG